jgi:hypothetical protein
LALFAVNCFPEISYRNVRKDPQSYAKDFPDQVTNPTNEASNECRQDACGLGCKLTVCVTGNNIHSRSVVL